MMQILDDGVMREMTPEEAREFEDMTRDPAHLIAHAQHRRDAAVSGEIVAHLGSGERVVVSLSPMGLALLASAERVSDQPTGRRSRRGEPAAREPREVFWRNGDDVVALSPRAVEALAKMVDGYIQTVFGSYTALRARIDRGEVVTEADIDAAFPPREIKQ